MTTERNGVLAVMDEMIDCYGSVEECQDDTEFLVAARGARAAVAELIEALKAWDRWNYEVQSAKVTGESVYSFQELTDMRTEAVRLTDAALARVGGA